MPLVVLNSDNWATYSDIAEAITYAADNGVRVMNISIAGSSSSWTLQNAVDYAWSKGAVVIAAAANESTNSPYYPAAIEEVVAVAATNSNDGLASFSNYGDWIDLCAPGTSILTTHNGGGYGTWAGTSFSSPITAGVAALMLAENPGLTNTDLVGLLNGAADDLGDAGFDSTYGHGRVNAYNAVLAAMNADTSQDTTAPELTVISPSEGETVSGTVTLSASASDDTAVDFVNFYVDGYVVGSDSSSPFSADWDSSSYSDGSHKIKAEAVDSSGNSGFSAEIGITVDNVTDTTDTTSPTVFMTSPRDGETVSGSVTVSAEASDDVGVYHVDFYLNGGHLGSDAVSPYSLSLDTTVMQDGWHSMSAEAWDTSGNAGFSEEISVYVDNTFESSDSTAPNVNLKIEKIGNPRKPKFKIEAYGSDNVGVTRIAIYLDDDEKASENSDTVKWMWQTDKGDAGTHTVKAMAYDAAGNVGQISDEINL